MSNKLLLRAFSLKQLNKMKAAAWIQDFWWTSNDDLYVKWPDGRIEEIRKLTSE